MQVDQPIARFLLIAIILLLLAPNPICQARESKPGLKPVLGLLRSYPERDQPSREQRFNAAVFLMIGGIGIILLQDLALAYLMKQRRTRILALKQLARHNEMALFTAELSSSFVHVPANHDAQEYERAFGSILDFFQFDCVTLYSFAKEVCSLQSIALRTSPEVLPLEAIELTQSPKVLSALSAGYAIIGSTGEELDVDANFLEKLRGVGAVSIAVFPLLSDGELFAAFSVSTTRRIEWSPQLVESLKAITDVLGSFLQRSIAEKRLMASEALKTSILSSLGSQIAVLDKSFHIVALNERWREFRKFGIDHQGRIVVGGNFIQLFSQMMAKLNQSAEAMAEGLRRVCEGTLDQYETEIPLDPLAERRWLLMSVARLEHQEGGAVVALTDITERKRSEEAVQQMSGRLIHAQEQERTRIARELHDDINQQLALLGVGIQELNLAVPNSLPDVKAGLEEIWAEVHQTSTNVQRLSHELHSSKLQQLGLVGALKGLVQEFSRQQTGNIDFQFHHVPANLDGETSLTLFRLAQESLRNVVKHSHAKSVKIELIGENRSVLLRISDDGVGFDVTTRNRSGLGLVSMKERMRSVGGDLTIQSKPGIGTQVDARITLSHAADEGGASLPIAA